MSVAWLVGMGSPQEEPAPMRTRPYDPRSVSGSATPIPPVFLGRRTALSRRLYVLVEAEEIGRVVLVLQAEQTIIVRAVRRLHPVFSFLSQVVNVDAPLEERLHRLEERA